MKPVTQRVLHPPMGDCMAACIASILELDLAVIPNFHGDGWWNNWNDWLSEHHGLRLYWLEPWVGGYPPSHYIAVGPSPRDPEIHHAVVMFTDEVVHDPHPDGRFDPAGIVEWNLIVFDHSVRPRGETNR